MKNPTVIDPPNFDIDAAWGECRDWVDQHEPGSMAGAFGADPGCVSCPNCGEHYWAWGAIQRCECGFEFPVSWWPEYSQGVQDGRRVHEGAEVTGGMQRRQAASPYYRYGFDHPADNPVEDRRVIDWREVVRGEKWLPFVRFRCCERCGEDKTGSRENRSGLCVRCESETSCRHENRQGPWSLDHTCSDGIRLSDLIEDKPGWVRKIPCRFMFGDKPCECPRFEAKPVAEIEESDRATDAAIGKTLTAMTVVPKIKEEHKGNDWAGVIPCPVCDGRLHVTHAACNGHVHGKCETEECVAWIE